MSFTTHMDSLNQKHARLEAEIQQAYAMHASSDAIAGLKKQKLNIKDQMSYLRMRRNQLSGA